MTKETMFALNGKTAIVTGGARGIGKVVAEHMAMAGADIAVVDLLDAEGKETAEQIAKTYGVKAKAYVCNVTDPKVVESTVNQVAEDFGGLDVLFNNAGIVLHKPALEVTPEEWLNVINVNLNGVFYMAAAFARKLVALGRPGSVINNASMSATIVNYPQEQASYNSSKAAVVHMTKSLAVEWVKHNIRVNALSPGYIATDLTVHVRPDWIEQWKAQTPYGRLGKPEELAGLVIYLASDASTFTSGSNFIVDGCFSCV
jgi:NAD(P)-dependent dehydrogenase (short-subunit alcohol dehydrogenase family)